MNYFNIAVKITAPHLHKFDYMLSTGQEFSFFAKTSAEADEMCKKHIAEHIAPYCEHPEFKQGICVDCDYECEHYQIEENTCLDCGEWIEPDDPRSEPEYWEER